MKPVKFSLLPIDNEVAIKNCKMLATILFYIVRSVNDCGDISMVIKAFQIFINFNHSYSKYFLYSRSFHGNYNHFFTLTKK